MKVTKIKAGHYSVGDGRRIIKSGAQWYIYKGNGEIDFGPVPTLASAKEYVSTGSISLNEHEMASKYGRKQSKKEFNAYMAAEAKNGNFAPLILTLVVLFCFALIATLMSQR